ncbi:MAG: helix-turn-helix domain-containing protein [Verrucomicrobiota bacterium]|nr:helix-turn-helix domain-containing protein [Verrucomicrobiota bacterium]
MPRFKATIPLDDYVIDVLMRDIVGHDQQPAAYLVYLWLYGQAARCRWRAIPASLRIIAEATGLSKSAVQTALVLLRRRELIVTVAEHSTAVPQQSVLRHWRTEARPRTK